ncbi:MAG TPA: UDP-N-acetylglucosamine 2-epimerase (non-hydrolyzing), partial [Arenibaculum sp.]|nr:UDP-N-acetylglucosamine 2-epimerase (non-hydrolyzing) [Arenibaculum sp.]
MPGHKIHLIAGARPNFMKVAPLYHALAREPWCDVRLIHTGQHYSAEMSEAFFADLDLPPPDVNLEVGSGSHARQTGRVMTAYEDLCRRDVPDWIVVVGDVNSTLAVTLAAKKLNLPVAHLEAGLRSRDRTMPEEINRLVTDVLADLLWTPSPDADENLLREGIAPERIVRVGNIMIDAFELQRDRIMAEGTAQRLGLAGRAYAVVTLHRPANVDDRAVLEGVVDQLCRAAERLPLVFPVHPRTAERLEAFGLAARLAEQPGILATSPLPYRAFMNLVVGAAAVITDSGGIQEETTYLSIPCLTLRPSTERPVTVTEGTNRLIRAGQLGEELNRALAQPPIERRRPGLWDGRTAGRVVDSLRTVLGVC